MKAQSFSPLSAKVHKMRLYFEEGCESESFPDCLGQCYREAQGRGMQLLLEFRDEISCQSQLQKTSLHKVTVVSNVHQKYRSEVLLTKLLDKLREQQKVSEQLRQKNGVMLI